MDDSVYSSARTRILTAANEVFARVGLTGSTTREIARIAGVNEATLFDHFSGKEQLLGAIIQQAMALQAEALAHQDEWTQNLHLDLAHYAQLYNYMLEEQEALIRRFIGEAHQHSDTYRQVIQQAVQPLREKLITYLRNGQTSGTVRKDVALEPAVDLFSSMLLGGMLRRTVARSSLGYSSQLYIESCVDIFVRGISPVYTSTLDYDSTL
jgi:AcrR family transcriptional regulator